MAKILIIGPAYPLRGGLATFDELFCKAFNEQGHDCEIISYSLQYPNFLVSKEVRSLIQVVMHLKILKFTP